MWARKVSLRRAAITLETTWYHDFMYYLKCESVSEMWKCESESVKVKVWKCESESVKYLWDEQP